MLVRCKFFPQFVAKIERLNLSLSKQHNNMLKIRFEMLKIKRIWQIKPAREKISGKFLDCRESRGFSRSRLEKLKIRDKGKP